MADTQGPVDSEGIPAYNPDDILVDPNAHPLHKMYAEINIRVRDLGEVWSKCMNCGIPYEVTDELSTYFCRNSCESEYTSSMYGQGL